MNLLALTKRSAFYIEEKRQTEETHYSPSFNCSRPASKRRSRHTAKSQTGCAQRDRLDPPVKGLDLEVMYRFTLQPIRDEDRERWTNWQSVPEWSLKEMK
ncbi:hypothetical protein INR49_029609 [Caranx melampygus]|nr:hypothetical protein INR49_029609 [Caranx melampygus]